MSTTVKTATPKATLDSLQEKVAKRIHMHTADGDGIICSSTFVVMVRTNRTNRNITAFRRQIYIQRHAAPAPHGEKEGL